MLRLPHRSARQLVEIELITVEDEFKSDQQVEFFKKMQINALRSGVKFHWRFESSSIHARHIVTDTGWKISLDRGLDVFQRYDTSDPFSLGHRIQKQRKCKPFEVTYLRV